MRNAAVRPVIVAVMLGLTGIVAAVLAAQAAYAVRGHRMAAERVLHDYASLGAEGAAQRLRNNLAARFNNILNAAASVAAPAPITPAAVRAALPEAGRAGVTDSIVFARVNQLDSIGAILMGARGELPSFAYFGLRWIDRDGRRALMLYQPFRPGVTDIVAVTIPEHDARAMIGKMIASIPILPASLTRGNAPASGLGMRVTSAHATLAAKAFDSTTAFRARTALDAPYADLDVEVSLSESMAPALIAGGLPASRMPLLIILVAVSIGLTIAAGDQLRRELALSRLREDFVSSVSHELRTPLAQIRMFAETLRLKRVRTPGEETKSLGIIEKEARRMEHLVENLMHFSRAERRAQRVSPVPANLSNLVRDTASEFAPLAERQGSRLAMHVEPEVAGAADPAALRQALLNLLDNAVKYGAPDQTITVALTTDDRLARITVEDQGDGVDPAECERIWERFSRGNAARRTGAPGTGVGLAIVRDIVALHNGATRVERASGGGARMVIELPARTGS